ncbi:mannan endo-1,4-beta-mannosidase [Flaviramulus basaltis]|uniref:Mannan endo-1,4-beta-mannosidase n=1 Tax=Flaviramulus basaltis TaxID=369401 RepID=A0A1K2ILW3_9FLAO|nr:glycosyl hydrolase [Flaviramulus basaltis]SFZ93444.1 mannan endo-1,4-beta-mannosidase [Flaviramulus basaltis]
MHKGQKTFNFNKHFVTIVIVLFFAFLNSCKPFYNSVYKKPQLVDSKPSKSIKQLHKKLFYISKEGFAIGHQDATSYGIGWKESDFPNTIKSDVNDIIGDFPAVYGFDIGRIEHGYDKNLDGVPFETMRKLMIDAHKNGGIITVSWHADNPSTGGDSWDKTAAVKDVINNGQYKDKYLLWLDKVADFLNSIKYNGVKVPIIFRPFHEMNGAWFWWGDPNCTTAEYVQLWKETVDYLKNKHKLHNLIYAYSPNKLNPNDDYMKYYPGDDYVDFFGIDIYDFNNSEDYKKSVVNDLKIVKDVATSKNKLYAFTETGIEAIPTNKWFTEVVYPSIENTGIAYILFWRNYTKKHHYMPYKTHSSEEDFKVFEKLPKTLFLKDINNIKY